MKKGASSEWAPCERKLVPAIHKASESRNLETIGTLPKGIFVRHSEYVVDAMKMGRILPATKHMASKPCQHPGSSRPYITKLYIRSPTSRCKDPKCKMNALNEKMEEEWLNVSVIVLKIEVYVQMMPPKVKMAESWDLPSRQS